MNEGKRLEASIELDADVDQVWEAVTTGAGFATWFVPHDFETDEEGKPQLGVSDFGSGNESRGRLLAWEPKRRVVYGTFAESPTEALEYLVEGREGGGTVLRLVQSGIQGEDWEMEYHAKGWEAFFHNLATYFKYFAGKPASNALAMAFTTIDANEVWDRFHTALGTDRGLAEGEAVSLTPAGVEPIKGVVDRHAENIALGVRTDSGLYRFAGEGSGAWGMVNVCHYQYGTGIDSQQWTATWQAWLSELFPASEAPVPPQAG